MELFQDTEELRDRRRVGGYARSERDGPFRGHQGPVAPIPTATIQTATPRARQASTAGQTHGPGWGTQRCRQME